MDDFISPNLGLPYIAPAQAQKHVTHNEAIRGLDALVQLTVSGIFDAPPDTPIEGQRLIIGSDPSGEFVSHAGNIAAFQDGAWAFFKPLSGWHAYNQAIGSNVVFDGTNWSAQDDAPSLNPAPFIGVNATADINNRLSINSPASLFNHDGAGHQLKINKQTEADTASLLFQDGFVGQAEMGLTGKDDFHIKTSADGSVFHDALVVNKLTADVAFPAGHSRDQMLTAESSAGGPSEVYGPPNLVTVAYARGSQTLTKNRMYFCAFFVDRPTVLTGAMVSVYNPGSTGPVLRCGIYRLGTANGSGWDIGERITDFGVQPSDVASNKILDMSVPVTLEPGWYAGALGTNGTGVGVRYIRAMTPGNCHFTPHSSGASSDIRSTASGTYLFNNDAGVFINDGLPSAWPNNPISGIKSTSFFTFLMVVPRWQMWS